MRSFQSLAPRRLQIVYLDAQRDTFTPEYLAARGIGKSVLLVQLPSPAVAYAYDARAVPQLLLMDNRGRVRWSHIGELSGRRHF
jgi:hypothetical protein